MINKKQPLKELTFVAFDIETTNLMPVVNRIVEIGAVKFNSKEVIDTFQELSEMKTCDIFEHKHKFSVRI